jgi:hypothetical protein
LDCFFFGRKGDDGCYGSKDFFLDDACIVRNVDEDCGLVEVSGTVLGITADQSLGASVESVLYKFVDGIYCFLFYEGATGGVRV